MQITADRLKMLLADAEQQQENAENAAIQWSGRVIALKALIDMEKAPEPEEKKP